MTLITAVGDPQAENAHEFSLLPEEHFQLGLHSEAGNRFDPRVILMERSGVIKSGIHYHMRWSDTSLDWKAFPTKEEATMLAGHIKRRDESFIIVERDEKCERCKMFQSESRP